MPNIQNYIQQDDGTITAVIEGVTLENKDFLLLDNGLEVECDVIVSDPYKITDKQRKKIFAMCRDIELYWGEPVEALRQRFQSELEIMNGYERISLRDCTRKIASELIELIIAFMFHHQVPMRVETSKLLQGDKAMLYWATVNRNCVICGASNSDLAHYETVGRGMNRRTMNHYDKHVLALCRRHHNEQHNIGVKSFDDKYHLHNSWIAVDDKLNSMLRGEKQ
ncbi:putative HNHc nuclease [Staphylococcus sp. GDK8D68P]|uniref:putative HNHc nuclease n=1 Tax=Staphylococcus sp. GDK8D68P TaxID=2804092 RepID=UPI001AEC07F6|nr:putative HNHc nuclease [Staphylococcus sp. GDK8D68P]